MTIRTELDVYEQCRRDANNVEALGERMNRLHYKKAMATTDAERADLEKKIGILARRVARLTADD